jgi:pimeloyl-ACP methyl ester carboxylesterase
MAVASCQAQEPSPPGKFIDLGGRRLHLKCAGADSPSVLVLNGGGSFSVEWALVQTLVESFARICAYDRAGYAWSDRGPVDDGIEEIMDDLSLLLRKAAIAPPYVLVGHSLGSLYARAYQRRFPDQVAGLVLVDGTHDEDIRIGGGWEATTAQPFDTRSIAERTPGVLEVGTGAQARPGGGATFRSPSHCPTASPAVGIREDRSRLRLVA